MLCLILLFGERGVGKSYAFKKYEVKHFLKTNKQFVYIRRYKQELAKALVNDKKRLLF